MLALKYMLMAAGVMLLAAALGITLFDLWLQLDYRRKKAIPVEGVPMPPEPEAVRWRTAMVLLMMACVPVLEGLAGVRRDGVEIRCLLRRVTPRHGEGRRGASRLV